MITLKVRIPAPSRMLLVNLLGVASLLGVALAVGGLTHNFWWGLLTAAIEGVAVTIVAALNLDETDASRAIEVRPRAA